MIRTFLVLLSFFVSTLYASELSHLINTNQEGVNKIGVINIEKDHPIDQSTLLYVKLALEEFKKQGAICAILNLDTPGGEVFSAMKISSLLEEYSTVENIPVITFINSWAISAGALIAYSTPYIVVTKSSLMGAAQPVMMGPGGSEPKAASEKVVSALRAEFASTAEFYSRNPDLAEAMVDSDVIVVWRKGQVVRLKNDSEIKKSDQIISSKGKLLTLRGEEMMEFGVANEITSARALLDIPFFKDMQSIELIEYSHWKVKLYSFLTNPFVASILMMALALGFYIEVSSPGFGWAGMVALIALGLILLTNFTLFTAGHLELIMLCLGAALIIIDLFFISGFGVIGSIGIILALISMFLLFVPYVDAIDLVTFNLNYFEIEALMSRLTWLMLYFILACAIVVLLAKLVSKKVLPHLKVISKETSPDSQVSFKIEEGSIGVAFTSLRPSGKVEIDGEIYNAISEGRFIEKGSHVVVLRQEGEKVVVK
ncbi:MAG: NfeD family protein [Rhabdochlamydiaceae bacterium]|nr:NfeD family protein [Candidatus Amphrikana amoebophyrae]